eukprot:GHVU01074034.1.p1 GENE.GHVU01074034.1~~GHVU01074034.1.p1  ORF type:complete len:297 (-),score=89.29 GHVU01074034.1:603-1361(-)
MSTPAGNPPPPPASTANGGFYESTYAPYPQHITRGRHNRQLNERSSPSRHCEADKDNSRYNNYNSNNYSSNNHDDECDYGRDYDDYCYGGFSPHYESQRNQICQRQCTQQPPHTHQQPYPPRNNGNGGWVWREGGGGGGRRWVGGRWVGEGGRGGWAEEGVVGVRDYGSRSSQQPYCASGSRGRSGAATCVVGPQNFHRGLRGREAEEEEGAGGGEGGGGGGGGGEESKGGEGGGGVPEGGASAPTPWCNRS